MKRFGCPYFPVIPDCILMNGKLKARYKNAICFVRDEAHIYEAMEPSMASEPFLLTDQPHSTVRKEGS